MMLGAKRAVLAPTVLIERIHPYKNILLSINVHGSNVLKSNSGG